MKKILIVNKSFALGGIQSSMINMANELSKYHEVHLYLYQPKGVMKERLDPKVKVLKSSPRFLALGMSFLEAMRSGNIRIMTFRFFATGWSRLFGNRLPISLAISKQEKLCGYDLAIAYHHENLKKVPNSGYVRFVDACVEAKTKAAWIHYDPASLSLDPEYNAPFYAKMDRIVCVSKALMHTFSERYPALAPKLDYCYNFLSFEAINEQANLPQSPAYPKDSLALFSACRLNPEKAIPRAIEAMKECFWKHPNLVWYIAGEGPERAKIEEAIAKCGLQNRVVLLGNQKNPYPFIKNADLVLNVSYHEAAPMVFFESLFLGTPVFATRTSSAEEMLCHGENAFLCANSKEGIALEFSNLLEHKEQIKTAKSNLKNTSITNEKSFLKMKELLG